MPRGFGKRSDLTEHSFAAGRGYFGCLEIVHLRRKARVIMCSSVLMAMELDPGRWKITSICVTRLLTFKALGRREWQRHS